MSPNPISSAIVTGLLSGLFTQWLLSKSDLVTNPDHIPAEKRQLCARVGRIQLPIPLLTSRLEKFVRNGVEDRRKGRSLRDILDHTDSSGAKLHAYSGDSGKRVFFPDEPSLSEEEMRIWRKTADCGGGWCCYFRKVAGCDALDAEYIFVTWSDNELLSTGVRL